MLAIIVKKKGFCAPLTFVIAGAAADGIDISPVRLWLGLDLRVAIDLRGGGLQDLGPYSLGQPQHIDCSVHGGLGGLHRIVLVVDRRGGTGQVVYFIHFHVQGKGDVSAQEFEPRVVKEVVDIGLVSGVAVVSAEDLVSFIQESLAEVGA